jgi:hypothetical protein
MGRRVTWVLLLCGAFRVEGAPAQSTPPPAAGDEAATVVPAAYCGASRPFASLAGAGYRALWTTPIRVPVADLGRLGGGRLTPLRVGGGVTTQTLHARGADGRRYVFRSVQKTTRQALAEEFWGTPVEAVMRDQLCSFHPSGAGIVADLLDAVGVLHTEPRLMVLPDDPRLGEFREQFAGMLVLFEGRPDESPGGGPGFAGSDRIVQMENLLDALEEDPDERMDATDLLRSRLVDLLVGDRDRSINNYLWARFDDAGGGHVWRPIPRDRDQAFVRFDGALKSLARHYENRLVAFGDAYPDVEGLTRNAWDIDRNLLVGVERDAWDAVVRQVQEALPDDVIAQAVRRLPPEHYALIGRELEASLRLRRDALPAAADALYGIVFGEADIHTTDVDEVVRVEGLDDGGVRVAVRRRVGDGGREGVGPAHFERTFSPRETRELRIYLHGGDDLVRLEGGAASPIGVRIVGGGGADAIENRAGRRGVTFYDDGDETLVSGEGVRLVRRDAPRVYSWWVDGERDPDWGSDTYPLPGLSYDGDRGLVVGMGLRRDGYAFLEQPFATRLRASVGWAVERARPIVDTRLLLRDRVRGWNLGLRGRWSGIEVLRFYGFGNETVEVESQAYYRVRQTQVVLGVDLSIGDGDHRRASLGPVFRYTSSDTSEAAFITESRPYGTGAFTQAGIRADFTFDDRDVRQAPWHGYRLEGGGTWYPELFDVSAPFAEVHGEATWYTSPPGGNPTLALRAGGKKLWGTYPYSDAAYIGGANDVRGLREQRYAGDAAVYASAEVRLFIAHAFFLFPMDFGVFGLMDTGRVFLEDESSKTWHDAWGGGLWFAPVGREATVRLSAARHAHRTSLYVGMGFAY